MGRERGDVSCWVINRLGKKACSRPGRENIMLIRGVPVKKKESS